VPKAVYIPLALRMNTAARSEIQSWDLTPQSYAPALFFGPDLLSSGEVTSLLCGLGFTDASTQHHSRLDEAVISTDVLNRGHTPTGVPRHSDAGIRCSRCNMQESYSSPTLQIKAWTTMHIARCCTPRRAAGEFS